MFPRRRAQHFTTWLQAKASPARTFSHRWRCPPMSRTLIFIGLGVAAVGLLWPWLNRLGLGRLPGDIAIERENFTFYAPLTTGILLSVAVSLILWLVNR